MIVIVIYISVNYSLYHTFRVLPVVFHIACSIIFDWSFQGKRIIDIVIALFSPRMFRIHLHSMSKIFFTILIGIFLSQMLLLEIIRLSNFIDGGIVFILKFLYSSLEVIKLLGKFRLTLPALNTFLLRTNPVNSPMSSLPI